MELEGHETTHILVFEDEVGFNLAKGQRRNPAISLDTEQQLAHQANVGIILQCAAISENGVSTHIPHSGP